MNDDALTFLGDVLPREPYAIEGPIPGMPVFNLEGPICRPLHPWPNKINLYAPENYLTDIFGDGPLIACLANNHIMDYGETGYAETISRLEATGVEHFGAGSIDEDCNNPLIINLQGLTVALIGFVCPSTHPVFAHEERPGVCPISLEAIRSLLRQVRQADVDQVVACLHWGPEEVSLPHPDDVQLARQIIDAGADLIIGHHPHRIQPYEIYKGKYIFYSLGNCIMPDLEEDARYNDDGQPQVHFVKKQSKWHRRALGVTYHPASRSVTMSMYHFDGQCLASNSDLEGPSELSISDPEAYGKRYKRAYYLGKLQYKLHTVLSQRKLPGLNALKSIPTILKELRRGAQESR